MQFAIQNILQCVCLHVAKGLKHSGWGSGGQTTTHIKINSLVLDRDPVPPSLCLWSSVKQKKKHRAQKNRRACNLLGWG